MRRPRLWPRRNNRENNGSPGLPPRLKRSGRGGKEEEQRNGAEFCRQAKRSGMDFALTICPPMAQEKTIAEAKALAEKE